MKTFRLALSYSKSLFLNNKALYIFFAAALTVTAFGYMTFFSSTYEATEEYTALRLSSRTFYLNFPSTLDNPEELQTLLEENEDAEILKARYTFEAEIAGEPVELCGYPAMDALPDVFMGRSFEENDGRAVIMLPPIRADEYEFGSAFSRIREMELEQETELSGKTYTVIGYCNVTEIIVPFKTGIEDFPVKSVSIEVSPETSENGKILFSKYLHSLFPTAELIEPEPVGQKTVTRMSLFIYGGLLIGVSAFLTFVFLFVYIIGRNMKDYIILRICGCSLKKMCALLIGQLAAVYTLCFIAAFAIAKLINLFIGSIMYIRLNITFVQAAVVYGVTMLMLALIFLPYAASAARKTVAVAKSME